MHTFDPVSAPTPQICASPEAETYLRDHGGRIFIWPSHHRCCGGRLTLLDTSTAPAQANVRGNRRQRIRRVPRRLSSRATGEDRSLPPWYPAKAGGSVLERVRLRPLKCLVGSN